MAKSFKLLLGATIGVLGASSPLAAQITSPAPTTGVSAPSDSRTALTPTATPAISEVKPAALFDKHDLAPVSLVQSPGSDVAPASSAPASSLATIAPVTNSAPTTAAPKSGSVGAAPVTEVTDSNPVTESGGPGVREFQGDDIGQVLRLLARQAKINMVVSEAVTGTVTMRLEDVTALQAMAIIVKAKGLFMDQIEGVYYIKTAAERTAEPTQSDSYQFSYGRAKDIAPLLASQLSSKDVPQVDDRTNTIFFRETRSNIDAIRKMLVQIDRPTKQVMIEARLVEVTANPKQSYGINWAGIVGSSSGPQTFTYGGSSTSTSSSSTGSSGVTTTNLALGNSSSSRPFGNLANNLSSLASGQFAILSVPQMSLTLRALNEDSDAEFLANPRVVTADNQQAKIEIIRNQPVPQLNFNAQTATAVFGGFEDKKYGNTLVVRPSVNKDNFITLSVKPEISNKVGDSNFVFAGATVASPIIDTRSLDSNVLIKSGDTLAIGGLLQDEVTKARSKVPVMGDIPVLGYLFQERLNARTKRNLLVFVTPTIIDQHYGTGLEDQVSGLKHSGEEYADPNGWRNNAKGAVRLVPTSNRQVVADYPKPGIAPAPDSDSVHFMTNAKDRDY